MNGTTVSCRGDVKAFQRSFTPFIKYRYKYRCCKVSRIKHRYMKIKNYLLLLLLACLWGPSFMFIKIAVQQASPLAISTFRIVIGATILFIILAIKKASLRKGTIPWYYFAISGFLNMALPYSLISWGEQYIDSALAGILNGLTPFFTLFITFFWNKEEKLGVYKIIGTLMGFGGLCFLLVPYINTGNLGSVLGIFLVSLAAASYGLAAVFIKKKLTGLRPLIAPAYQLLYASFMLLPVFLTFGNPSSLPQVDSAFWLAIASLGFFGTAMAYIVYFKIIERAEASFLTLVTYLMPVISVILGIVFLDERIYWNVYAGAALIVLGLFITNQKRVA